MHSSTTLCQFDCLLYGYISPIYRLSRYRKLQGILVPCCKIAIPFAVSYTPELRYLMQKLVVELATRVATKAFSTIRISWSSFENWTGCLIPSMEESTSSLKLYNYESDKRILCLYKVIAPSLGYINRLWMVIVK